MASPVSHLAVPDLVDALARSDAYFPRPGQVEIVQTHISIVALVGSVVYKIRKPVNLGFLDFTTLEQRRQDCFEEMRLNQRLTRDVYLGVVPITRTATGVRVDAGGDTGEVIEWAVKMARLPDDASLLSRLERGDLTREILTAVAQRIATFHAEAGRRPPTPDDAFAIIAQNVRDNFEVCTASVGEAVSARVFAEVRNATESTLARLEPLARSRAARGVPCDGHGDLRLEHVYVFDHAPSPNEVQVIDCVEFSDRLRFGDPAGDVAFLVMDLAARGHDDLAESFANSYFSAAHDEEGRLMLPFYVAYRSMVRAKVRCIEAREAEVGAAQRASALHKAQGHFLLALGALVHPAQRPALILVGGLPGTGKSTVARHLAEKAGFEVVLRSDVIRKELAGVTEGDSAGDDWGEGIYTTEWTHRTYAECLRRAEKGLLEGARVIVDATFADESFRREFIALAKRLAVGLVSFECRASDSCIRERLERRRGDASDADFRIYERAREAWEQASPECQRVTVALDTEPGIDTSLDRALGALRERGVWAPP